jgi:hypothetical protein
MNAAQIGAALAKGPSIEQIEDLVRACNTRRAEIDQRVRSLSAHPDYKSAERRAAELQGVDAVKALDDEAERLHLELALLNTLEGRANDERELRLTERAIAQMPGAKKTLPKRLAAARAALAALDATLADLAADVGKLAEYQRLPEKQFPLTDAELADLLKFRDAVWTQRNVATLIPRRESHPESWSLTYVVRPNGDWYLRKPGPHLPDFATDGR